MQESGGPRAEEEGPDARPRHPSRGQEHRQGARGEFARVAGYRRVTDAHLLALALRRGGTLAILGQALAALAGPDGRGASPELRFRAGRPTTVPAGFRTA